MISQSCSVQSYLVFSHKSKQSLDCSSVALCLDLISHSTALLKCIQISRALVPAERACQLLPRTQTHLVTENVEMGQQAVTLERTANVNLVRSQGLEVSGQGGGRAGRQDKGKQRGNRREQLEGGLAPGKSTGKGLAKNTALRQDYLADTSAHTHKGDATVRQGGKRRGAESASRVGEEGDGANNPPTGRGGGGGIRFGGHTPTHPDRERRAARADNATKEWSREGWEQHGMSQAWV